MEYTRITPAGEEKCSLRNGGGMTIEEKNKVIQEYCKTRYVNDDAICVDCLIENVCNLCVGKFGQIGFESETDKAYNILVNAGVVKPPVNFVKTSPDDAVESDAVNHPNHYTQNGIECIAAIRASMTADGFMDYCKGNVLKYIWRWRDKGGAEDLKKARVYLDWLIEEADK